MLGSVGRRLLQAKAGLGRDLAIMRRIDELHLEYPFAGSRMLRDMLARRRRRRPPACRDD